MKLIALILVLFATVALAGGHRGMKDDIVLTNNNASEAAPPPLPDTSPPTIDHAQTYAYCNSPYLGGHAAADTSSVWQYRTSLASKSALLALNYSAWSAWTTTYSPTFSGTALLAHSLVSNEFYAIQFRAKDSAGNISATDGDTIRAPVYGGCP